MTHPVPRALNLKNLRDISPLISEFEYYISYGSLLGYVRDRNLLELDDDVDYSMHIQHKEQMKKIFSENGFRLNVHGNNFVQGSRELMHDGKNYTTYIDFYFYENHEDNDYLIDRWSFSGQENNPEAALHIPKDLVYPIRDAKIVDIDIKIPFDSYGYAEYLYGKDYKIPLDKTKDYTIRFINNIPECVRLT